MPRLRTVRTQEDVAKVPQDQAMDIELEAAPAEQAAEVETEPEVELKPQIAEQKLYQKEDLEPPKEEPESDLRKRLADLERAETEATRLRQERVELERRLQEMQQAQSRTQEERNDAYYAGLLNAKEAAEAQAQIANREIETALAVDDKEAVAAAYRKLAKAEVALSKYDDQIGEYEEVRKQPKVEVQQQTGLEAAIAQYPEEAKQRFRAHPEYVTNPRMTAKLVAAHWDAVELGHQQYTPGYFKYLDDHVFEPKPALEDRIDREVEQIQRRAVVPAAPPTRDVPSVTTGRPQSTKVTLSAEEREIARMSKSKHQTVAEAELEYARQKLRYEEAKRAGQYRERG